MVWYDSMRLIVFLEQAAINTKPATWYESRMIAFIDPLHLCTTFGVIAF
jgi:hypothetical protein